MECNASYNERVANFATNDEQHDHAVFDFYIIQHPKVPDT